MSVNSHDGALRLYREFARCWHILSPPADYVEEAAFYGDLLAGECDGRADSLLELGSGGGNNASHMKSRFASVTLVDASAEMLTVSRELSPKCEHVQGDMRSVRLERQFDCVFIHDAIDYMVTLEDLRQALETAFTHCRPGGVAVFAPDHVSESFAPSTSHGGSDGDIKTADTNSQFRVATPGIRYLQWTWDPDPDDCTYLCDYAYLIRDERGVVRCEYDRHVCGLFSRQQWLHLAKSVGFQARLVPFQHSEVEQPINVFACQRPR